MKPLYLFHFLDHCGDSDEPMETWVAGWILKETKTYYRITTWLVNGDEEEVGINSDKVVIVKSCLLGKPKRVK